jgi:hypothetical protein
VRIKDAVYDDGCSKCGAGKKRIEDEVYGCDKCKKEISSPHDEHRTYLKVTVFYGEDKESANLHFCSWGCVFDWMQKIQKTKYKCDYFVSLPVVFFDGGKPGYKDFVKELRGARRTGGVPRYSAQHPHGVR